MVINKIVIPVLETVDNNGKPSARMVLLKKFDQNGFCFFTNSNSRKGIELANNQNVALCFYFKDTFNVSCSLLMCC